VSNSLIISVHIHKNAGMNFKKHLIKSFDDSLLLSYGRDERILERFFTKINVPKYNKSDFDNIAIIHGHFLTDLFDSLEKDIKYAIFLRDPVERVISNYYFLKRNNYKHSHICSMIAEGLGLEEYAELNSSQNVQTFFMANKPIEHFHFVGICEEYEKSVLLFDKLFNVKGSVINSLKYYKQFVASILNKKSELVMPDSLTNNKNPDKQTTSYDISNKLRDKIIRMNLLDYDLYKKGISHFRENCVKCHV
jgi:sulfotransferase famil protein